MVPRAGKCPLASKSVMQWHSLQELLNFRQNANDVGEQLLEDLGIKPLPDRKRKHSIGDLEEYHQGREDSKRINIGNAGARRNERRKV